MIDFRYHLVSLAAVLIALSIGIVLGAGPLNDNIGSTLSELDTQLGASVAVQLDCAHLIRVDFIAAGDLLNWVLARSAENRTVNFVNPHRLVALFFGAMGITEHAKVKLQLV